MFMRYLGGGLYHTMLRGIVNIADSLRDIIGGRAGPAVAEEDYESDDSDGDGDVEMDGSEEECETEYWNEGYYEDGDWDKLGGVVEEQDSDSSDNVDTDDETWVIGQGTTDYDHYTL